MMFYKRKRTHYIDIQKKEERSERSCISKIRLKDVYKRKWHIELHFRK